MKIHILLLALMAFAGVARAAVSYPAHGGYDCPGRINKVACFTDDHGIVTGLLYENDQNTQLTGFCGCTNNMTSTSLELDPNENIVSVTACRGTKYGYSSVLFVTDAGRELACGGSGPLDYAPAGYESYGRVYRNGDYVKGYKARGRGLMSSSREEGAADGLKHKKTVGWGWSSKCQTYTSPKQPVWASKKKEWYKAGYSSKDVGYTTNSYGSSWKSFKKYYKDVEGGKESRYFNDYTTYKKQAREYSHMKHSYKYEPGYYYAQVLPLASFKVTCDYFGNVYSVHSFCWNKAYVPPPPLDVLPVTVAITLEAGATGPVTCPISAALNQQLLFDLNQTAAGLLMTGNFSQLIADIAVQPASPSSCVPEDATHNATVTYQAAFLPANGVDLGQLVAALSGVMPSGTDLCTLVPGWVCDDMHITNLVVTYDTNVRKTMFELSRKAIRTQVQNMHSLLGKKSL